MPNVCICHGGKRVNVTEDLKDILKDISAHDMGFIRVMNEARETVVSIVNLFQLEGQDDADVRQDGHRLVISFSYFDTFEQRRNKINSG